MRYIFFFISLSVTAQNNLQIKEVDSLIDDYNKLFVIMKENIKQSFSVEINQETGNWKKFYAISMPSVESSPVSKESEPPSANLGLNWYTETNHNFKPGFSETEHLAYKTRFSSGLDWNVIGEGGYFRNKKQREIIYKEYERERLQKNRAENQLRLSEKLNLIDDIFDHYRLELYEHFQRFFEERQDFVRNLYQLELVNRVALVQAENEYKNILNKIRLFKLSHTAEAFSQLDSIPDLLRDDPELPAWESIEVDKLLELEKEEIVLTRDILLASGKTARTPRLRLKARYNYFTDIANNDRGYGSIGATLNVPIEFKSNSEWRANLMAESNEADFNFKRENLKQHLKSEYRSFYQLKNKKLELLNRMAYLDEFLQNEMVVHSDFNPNFSPANYINKGVESLKLREELISIQQQLIKKYFQFLFDTEYSADHLFGMSDIGMKKGFAKKATYIWKEEFAGIANERLIDLLKYHQIGALYLSPGESSDKLDDFLKLTKINHINVARLIGENSFAASENGIERLFIKLSESKKTGFSHVHLDIEPQQFPDFKSNRAFYDQQLMELFSAAIEWSHENRMELSVSVPMNLNEDIARLLARNDIEVNVMAYEQKDQQKLFNRTKELRQILKDSMVWVIRLKDFSDSELKEALTAILEEGIKKIGFYKFISLPNEI